MYEFTNLCMLLQITDLCRYTDLGVVLQIANPYGFTNLCMLLRVTDLYRYTDLGMRNLSYECNELCCV